VRLDDLEEGMRLSRNVIMKTGASVLPADTLIDASCIEKLKRYQALNNISGKVFIYK
jgi:putative two-component system response regulator